MLQISKEQFVRDLKDRMHEKYAQKLKDAKPEEVYLALGSLIKKYYSNEWIESRAELTDHRAKQAYYFSIEFLPGKMLKSNLLNLGLLDVAREAFREVGVDFEAVAAVEPDMALGNGGLGRLASCFMDSLASVGLPGNGNGIRYGYGLFKQKIVDGYQVELPDEWLSHGNPWEVKKAGEALDVKYGGNVYLRREADGELTPVSENQWSVRAVPYDNPMIGYENSQVNLLRLWGVEIPTSEEGNYYTIEQRRHVEDITSVLYPDDSNYDGQLLRLIQEYFFVSAGVQSIVRYYKELDLPLEEIHTKIAIHINDTHPALCVPEFMRILVDEEGMSWEKAWDVTVKTMSYTNHTILAEALEKWPTQMVAELLPRVFQIIQEIDRRFVETMSEIHPGDLVERTRIIQNGQVHMANLSIIGGHSVNGVAKIHSDLLKNVVLHDFYTLYPTRFNNKTNGIAFRRWSQIANENMSKLIDENIGKSWRSDANELNRLMNYETDSVFLGKLADVKLANKERLAKYIKEHNGIDINPNAIFDVQIKRLHAYKRQLMNLLRVVKVYLDLKENPNLEIPPRVVIFGAKAAPSYTYAKSIIKAINEVANLVNNDKTINDKLKVVFMENYNVTLAELIIPAADVSEQISLASKEASGTSNMKLMLNGAVTVATLDGANVEIKEAVGDENIVIFGMDEDEVYSHYNNHDYSARWHYENNSVINRVLNAFVDGTIPNINREGQEIFDSLVTYNDEYFTLLDFPSYLEAQERVDELFRDVERWNRMSLVNIAKSARFSSDATVTRYAKEIWDIKPTDKQRSYENARQAHAQFN
ncbi:MAG: glycogen/starch/alpha-glucan phosphorylase [Lactobacillales bacterium]|jgi:starch phosphorylase|nr:glycogen/starch/alpha-glucan phosphorylase [Lactobacillales bacterium]